MNKNSYFGIVVFLIFYNTVAHQTPFLERNPFEFKQESNTQQSISLQQTNVLSKWNIKENGNELIIIENIDDGQIRTIEMAPFTH